MASSSSHSLPNAQQKQKQQQQPKGILHIEVRLRPAPSPFCRADEVREEVCEWILKNFAYLKVGETVSSDESLESAQSIESIKVDGYFGRNEDSCFSLENLVLDVQVYRLQHGDAATGTLAALAGDDEDEDTGLHQVRVASLPHTQLDGLWESLTYPGDLHMDLLRVATRMLAMLRKSALDHHINWNGLFLLHGPPGSGKTTMCRGLAQKLKIRLGKIYTHGKIIEVHPETLLSKYFGESAKTIAGIFNKIQDAADSEPETLICVMIDEVESLVSPRERSMCGEIADAMRVTNTILTALDRLRQRPNVMVLCTSNLPEAIDSAFLDRVDMSQAVPNPGSDAVYSILRSSLNELIKQNILTSTTICGSSSNGTGNADAASVMMEDPFLFPPLSYLSLMAAEDSLGFKLWHFSKKCAGMSGRSVRRLPLKAIGLYTYSDRPSISEVVDGLQAALGEEGPR